MSLNVAKQSINANPRSSTFKFSHNSHDLIVKYGQIQLELKSMHFPIA